MLTTRSVIKTLERLKFADLRQLAQENGLHIHSKMTKKEIIRGLLLARPQLPSLNLYGGARTESPSTNELPPVEWDKIPETALIEIIKQLPSRKDFNRFRHTSKKFNDRIKQLETKDFYKELIAKLPTNYVPIVLLNVDSAVNSVAWSPDGTRLASGGNDNIIRIWKFDPKTETFQQKPLELSDHNLNVFISVAWSPDGTRVTSSGYDGIIRIWKFDPKTKTFQFQQDSTLEGFRRPVMSVSWSPDDTRLASGRIDGIIRIWNFDPEAETFQQKPQTLSDHTGPVMSVSWSPDGTRLASGESDGIRIWKFDPKPEPQKLEGYTEQVLSVVWSPDGTRLASGGSDGIRIWKFDPKTKTFQFQQEITRSPALSVVWSPDGARLASGGSDGIILIWNFDPKTETFQKEPLKLSGHTDFVNSVAWSPDGNRLASAGIDGKILIWMS